MIGNTTSTISQNEQQALPCYMDKIEDDVFIMHIHPYFQETEILAMWQTSRRFMTLYDKIYFQNLAALVDIKESNQKVGLKVIEKCRSAYFAIKYSYLLPPEYFNTSESQSLLCKIFRRSYPRYFRIHKRLFNLAYFNLFFFSISQYFMDSSFSKEDQPINQSENMINFSFIIHEFIVIIFRRMQPRALANSKLLLFAKNVSAATFYLFIALIGPTFLSTALFLKHYKFKKLTKCNPKLNSNQTMEIRSYIYKKVLLHNMKSIKRPRRL